MDSVHYDNINCLAYYGITTGKTEDTFDPQSNVTRSQMALFLARAADKANIEIDLRRVDGHGLRWTWLTQTTLRGLSAINSLVSGWASCSATAQSLLRPAVGHSFRAGRLCHALGDGDVLVRVP